MRVTSRWTTWTQTGALAVVTVLLGVLGASGAQGAISDGNGEETPGGYGAEVFVDLEGHVSQDQVARLERPRPVCWWTRPGGLVDPGNPVEWGAAYRASVESMGADAAERKALLLPKGLESLDDAVARETDDGVDVTWWELAYDYEALLPDVPQGLSDHGCTHVRGIDDDWPFSPVIVTYDFFDGTQPPPPTISPAVLAAYAYDAMDLVPPALEWNPRITENGGAALVNLPTWVWVRDRASVAVRTVTATALGVSVTVTAEPTGMQVTGPFPREDCTPGQARRRYRPGRAPARACRVTFTKGSYGLPDGFAVTASTGWTASWTHEGSEPVALPLRTVDATTGIPVAQSQALVTDVD